MKWPNHDKKQNNKKKREKISKKVCMDLKLGSGHGKTFKPKTDEVKKFKATNFLFPFFN